MVGCVLGCFLPREIRRAGIVALAYGNCNQFPLFISCQNSSLSLKRGCVQANVCVYFHLQHCVDKHLLELCIYFLAAGDDVHGEEDGGEGGRHLTDEILNIINTRRVSVQM